MNQHQQQKQSILTLSFQGPIDKSDNWNTKYLNYSTRIFAKDKIFQKKQIGNKWFNFVGAKNLSKGKVSNVIEYQKFSSLP